MLESYVDVKKNASKVKSATLILLGSDDKRMDNGAPLKIHEQFSSLYKTVLINEGLDHSGLFLDGDYQVLQQ
jgi:esterase/lipase